jgi:hypothetical protein
MASKPYQPSIPQIPVSPIPTTIFQRLPQSHQQQLVHLLADLIRHVRTARQNREGGNHER